MIRQPLPDLDLFGEPPSPDELRAWRSSRRVSQAELAAILNVQPLAVLRWERGQRPMPAYLHLALRGIDELMRLYHNAPAPARRVQR